MRGMNTKTILAFLGVFWVGVVAGFFGASWKSEHSVPREMSSQQVRQDGGYEYINPLLECEVADGMLDARKENFHDELEEFVTKIRQENKVSEVAFYFRDLNNGPAFGLNLDSGFFPASLLKVPVLMAYYHLSESNPNLLQAEVRFEKVMEFGIDQTIVPRESLTVGEVYRVDELLRRMIVFSDNQALFLLTSRLPLIEIKSLFAMLGADTRVLSDPEAKLSVKEYASFFRILFNSSFLSRENSEKALALLATTDYRDALPAGVPDTITVSHKFGEAGTGSVERQLHDCGIVYFPGHPYLACIMTRGENTETLKEVIAQISRFIYQKIDDQY